MNISSVIDLGDRYFIKPYSLGKDLYNGKKILELPYDPFRSVPTLRDRFIYPLIALSLRVVLINSLMMAILDIIGARFKWSLDQFTRPSSLPKERCNILNTLDVDTTTYECTGIEMLIHTLRTDPNLEELHLGYIQNDVEFEQVMRAIKEHPALQRLYFRNSNLNNTRLVQIAEALKDHATVEQLLISGDRNISGNREWTNYGVLSVVKKLILSDVRLTDEAVEEFTEAFEREHRLEELTFEGMRWGKETMIKTLSDAAKKAKLKLCTVRTDESRKLSPDLVKGLKENTVTTLRLDAKLTDADIFSLGEALKYNTSLETLDLEFAGIDDDKLAVIATALTDHPSLRALDLFGNGDITAKGAASLRKILLSRTPLRELRLGRNTIGDLGAHQIASALEVNTSLRVLDLGSNELTDEGFGTIAGVLTVNHTLQTLSLEGPKVTLRGIENLASCLEHNFTLSSLALRGCNITPAGAQILATSLMKKNCVRSLDLSVNPLGDEGVNAFAEILKRGSNLEKVNFSHTKMTWQGACDLADVLTQNSTLLRLVLGYQNGGAFVNEIGNLGAAKFITALIYNRTLQELFLARQNIGTQVAQELVKQFDLHPSLRLLDLQLNPVDQGWAESFRSRGSSTKQVSIEPVLVR